MNISCLKYLFIFLICLLNVELINGQENTVKAMIAVFPAIYSTGFLSVGYDYQFTRHSAIDVNGFYFLGYYLAETGSAILLGINLGYRLYSVSEKKGLNNFWVNPYFLTFNGTGHSHSIDYRGNFFGLGISVGRRITIADNNKWVFDIGFGMAYGIFHYTEYREDIQHTYYEYTIPEPRKRWIPRPILQVGYRF